MTRYESIVLRLPENSREERRVVELRAPTVLQPFALLFWRAAAGSRVHQISVNLQNHLAGAVPALLFEADIAWSYFLTLAERQRPDGLETVDHRSLGKIFRFDLPALTSTDVLRLDLEGSYRHAVVLARTPALELPAPEPGVLREVIVA